MKPINILGVCLLGLTLFAGMTGIVATTADSFEEFVFVMTILTVVIVATAVGVYLVSL